MVGYKVAVAQPENNGALKAGDVVKLSKKSIYAGSPKNRMNPTGVIGFVQKPHESGWDDEWVDVRWSHSGQINDYPVKGNDLILMVAA